MTKNQIICANINEITKGKPKVINNKIAIYEELLISEEFSANRGTIGNNHNVLCKVLAYLKNYNFEDIYMSYYFNYGKPYFYKNKEESIKNYPLSRAITNNFTEITNVKFAIQNTKVPLGYINTENYDTSLKSQQNLVKDVLKILGFSVYGDFNDEQNAEKLEELINPYTDYELLHGNTEYCEELSLSEYVDGKLYNYNNSVLEEFWNFDKEANIEYLNDMDPDNSITVCHRKGKDFYIGYGIEEYEYEIKYKEIGESVQDECFYLYLYKEEPDLKTRITETIKQWKEDCEIRSFISNELEVGDYTFYNKGIVHQRLVKKLCDDGMFDIYDLKNEIEQNIKWNLNNIEEEFTKTYKRIVKQMLYEKKE